MSLPRSEASPSPAPKGALGDRTDADSGPSHWLRWHTVAALLVVTIAYVWLISAGRWSFWPTYSDRYDRLADAFSRGQTHLVLPQAEAALAALRDPYDADANKAIRKQPGVHDACLYDGRLYYYWGPAPALLLLPGKRLIGEGFHVADQYLVFGFAVGIVLVSAIFLADLRRTYMPAAPAASVSVAVLVAGLSTPITCIMTRAAVYEAAILGGQFFLLAGIYLAWRGLRTTVPTSSEAPGRRPGLITLALAGLSLSAAVGSRVSLAIAVVGIAVVVTITLFRSKGRMSPRPLLPVLSFGLPLVASAVLLCAYNQARFAHPLQFGQKYQLAGVNLLALPKLFGPEFVLPNSWSYFARPIAFLGRFPFVIANTGHDHFPAMLQIPPGYEVYEPITGLPWVMPTFIALIAALGVVVRTGRRSPLNATETRLADRLAFPVTLLLLAAILGFAPVLLMIGSSQRYLADFTPSLVIVSVLAVWWLTDRRRVSGATVRGRFLLHGLLSAYTVVVGLLISIEGYSAHFRYHNAGLYDRMRSADHEEVHE